MVTVVLHAALAEMVSVLALHLFPPSCTKNDNKATNNVTSNPYYPLMLRSFAKLLFAFHPTHVEAVANAANRPHVLAVVFSMLALDPAAHILTCTICVALGLLSSETAIFQIPAILLTMTVIQWKR